MLEFLARRGVCLAPMAGVADRAMRELCVAEGAAFCVGEMVSAKGLVMGDGNSDALMRHGAAEGVFGVQLFGSDPEILATAVTRALAHRPAFIDVNMGCPAPKIAHAGAGAALMRDPGLCEKIIYACVRAAEPENIPVSAKMRSGWDDRSINAPDVARACAAGGAAFLTVHGRTRAQMYAPPVDFAVIAAVKAAAEIPVIGNGDVADGPGAARMLEETGCDMVMVGRAAQGRPWVMRQITSYLARGKVISDPSPARRMDVMLDHVRRLCAYKGDYIGLREARKHAAWYTHGLRGGAQLRARICTLSSFADLEQIAAEVKSWWCVQA
jgi:nifR3 family TIM-barrel protein